MKRSAGVKGPKEKNDHERAKSTGKYVVDSAKGARKLNGIRFGDLVGGLRRPPTVALCISFSPIQRFFALLFLSFSTGLSIDFLYVAQLPAPSRFEYFARCN